jgi:hypothetical protein
VTDAILLAVTKLALATSTSPSPSAFSPNVVSSRATDDNIVRPGWIGFIVFLAMAAATYLLLRSFVRHMKRVNFQEAPEDVSSSVGKSSAGKDAAGPPSGDGVEV